MKHHILAFSVGWLLICAAPAYAQEGGAPIKITSTLHGDGSRTDTQKDIDNHVTETKTYDASKKLVQRCVMTLNDEGLATEGVVYNAKDVVMARMVYKYDPLGKLSEQINQAPNGTLLGRLVFTYDPTGKMTVQAFDAKGNLIKGENSTPAQPRVKGSRSRN